MTYERLFRNDDWREVRRNDRCIGCGGPDWCARTGDGTCVLCMRSAIARAGWKWIKSPASGGNVFVCEDGFALPVIPLLPADRHGKKPPEHWESIYQLCREDCRAWHVERLARDLRVTPDSLRAFGVGWHALTGRWAFPFRDHQSRIIGLQVRTDAGRKTTMKGARNGLFVPRDFAHLPGPLLLTEGVSDAAAGRDMGLATVGRPGRTGGFQFLADLFRDDLRELVVVGDNDENGDGQTSARRLAQQLAAELGRAVGIWVPPAPDLRALLHQTRQLGEVSA